MFKNFFPFILLLALVFNLSIRTQVKNDLHNISKNMKSSQTTVVENKSLLISSNCFDCTDTDCHENSHCSHHCLGHNLINSVITKDINQAKEILIQLGVNLSIPNHYLQPSIDPALKPPKKS